ncbi:MAG TPA: hypothetical protein VGJ58_10905 [Gaiellaceae bacterium]
MTSFLREGVSSLLAGAGYDVVGQAGDADTLSDVIRNEVPDLAVIDIRMPPTQTWEGLEAARGVQRVEGWLPEALRAHRTARLS